VHSVIGRLKQFVILSMILAIYLLGPLCPVPVHVVHVKTHRRLHDLGISLRNAFLLADCIPFKPVPRGHPTRAGHTDGPGFYPAHRFQFPPSATDLFLESIHSRPFGPILLMNFLGRAGSVSLHLVYLTLLLCGREYQCACALRWKVQRQGTTAEVYHPLSSRTTARFLPTPRSSNIHL
jgi:hypothetical protein